jgi:hypothetical protein
MKTAISTLIVLCLCSNTQAEDRSKTRLQLNDLQYVGAFRVPHRPPEGEKWRSDFSYGGTGLAYNPRNHSLFLVGHPHQQLVAEVAIPVPVKSEAIGELPTGKMLQPFADVREGTKGGNRVGGLLVDGERLLWTSYVFYDADGSANTSHGISSLDLAHPSARGTYTLKGIRAGVVAGYMCHVPLDWRKQFGVPVLTGQAGIPIVARTSSGPAAIGFDPDKLGKKPAPQITFLYYPLDHPLGPMTKKNELWNLAYTMGGMAFVSRGGKAAVMFFGRRGLGEWWYGEGTTKDGKKDLEVPSKGPHAPPYQAAVWFYDPNDLLAVKKGRKKSWLIKPYLVAPLPNVYQSSAPLGGCAYDPQAGRLYVSETFADRPNQYDFLPVIHVYEIRKTKS